MKLHISHDNVFIDYVINAANDLGGEEHRFLILTNNGEQAKRIKNKNIFCAQYASKSFNDFVSDAKQFETVYVHWLYGDTARFVNSLPLDVKVVWCFWGGDGLEMPDMLKDVYQPLSFRYFLKHNPQRVSFTITDMKGFMNEKRRKTKLYSNNIKAIKRVDYFAHYLIEDYNIVKKHTSFEAVYIPFFYAPLEEIVPFNFALETNGDDIILGNSDTITNNHFEAIDLLSMADIQGKRVFCPLSYENGNYAADVASYGSKKLGSAFIPLRNYLEKEEYNKILSACSFGIMNHNRSQALGNILVLLWGGGKVFMSEQSTLFHYLYSNNVVVFPFQKSFAEPKQTPFVKLTLTEAEQNRKALMQLFSKQKHRQQMRNLFALK